MIICTFQFFLSVRVGALFLIFTISFLCKILAKLGLVLGLNLVLRVFELACIGLTALVLEEIPADTIPLQSEELLHLGLLADVDRVDALRIGRTVEDGDKGRLYLF